MLAICEGAHWSEELFGRKMLWFHSTDEISLSLNHYQTNEYVKTTFFRSIGSIDLFPGIFIMLLCLSFQQAVDHKPNEELSRDQS